MEIEIDLNKTMEENAAEYFEKSKLSRKKISGLKKAIEITSKKKPKEGKKEVLRTKKKWFQNYRWFFTSENALVVGGKNAIQNEELVKKQMKKEDLYFHADVHGAPHTILKTINPESQKKISISEKSMQEAAQFALTYSKAWEQNISSGEAYSVLPEQVSKSAPTGTSIGKGAFMIYGERNWFKVPLSLSIGYYPPLKCLMGGPQKAIQKCSFKINLVQGIKEKNETAKELREMFNKKGLDFSVDEILSLLPNGKFDINN